MRIQVIALTLLLCLPFATLARGQALSPEEIESLNEDCLDCHEDMDEDEGEYVFPSGAVLHFQVDTEIQSASAHGKILACVSCHEGYDDDHPDFEEPTEIEYLQSRSLRCASCHEDIVPQHPPEKEGTPMCVDCHSAHRDPSFEASPMNILDRCGGCHEDEFAELKAGGHAESISLTSPNPDLPQCNTCHPAHEESVDSELPLNERVTTRCIKCHSSNLLALKYEREGAVVTSYMDDFHGLTFQHLLTDLKESQRVQIMTCATCHGPHNVRPPKEGELAAVCAECHEGTSAAFAGAWIGHGEIGPKHGELVWIIRVAYRILIPFMLIGLLMHILIQLRHHRRRRMTTVDAKVGQIEAEKVVHGLPASVVRFSRMDRAEHLLVVILFSMLVLTGIPQGYPNSDLGKAIVDFWGGIASTRLIHRTCGFSFVALMLIHLARGVFATIRSHQMPEILPTLQDFRDAFLSLKHHLGLGPAPRCGKFDYGEKFEYWGLFLGGCLIAGTGILLIFPEFTANYLPGIVLAAARMAHGYEATLALLVVLVWHLWGVTLRPDVFPLDTSMFTGRIGIERLREEHGLEYEKLLAERNREDTMAVQELPVPVSSTSSEIQRLRS